MANAFVQSKFANANTASSVSTTAPAVSTTAGNLLVALVTISNKGAVSSFTDSAGNTYTLGPAINSGATWWTSEIWYCFNAASVSSSGGSWTANGPGSSDYALLVMEYSGLGTGSLRTSGTVDQGSSSTSWSACTSAGSATAGDLVVAMAGQSNGSGTAGGSFTDRYNTATSSAAVSGADILSSGSGSQSVSWTLSPAKDGSAAIAVFAPAAAAGPDVVDLDWAADPGVAVLASDY